MRKSEDVDRVREEIRELLLSQYFAVLCTRGKTHPYCSLIGFAVTEDLRSIVFSTMKDTRKYNNILACGNVSFLIDSRKNRIEDLKDATALSVLGEVKSVDSGIDSERRKFFLARHPNLTSFLDDPNTVLVTVEVSRYIFVTRFQEVFELEIG